MQVKQAITIAQEYAIGVALPYVKGTVLPYAKEQAELCHLYTQEAYDTYKPLVIEKAHHYYEVALATYAQYQPLVKEWVQDKYTLAKGWVLDTAIPQLKVSVTFVSAYLEAFIVSRMEGPLEEPSEGLKSVMVQMVKTDFKAAVKTAKWAISEVLIAIGEVIFPYGLV
jgi:hypothetical protein